MTYLRNMMSNPTQFAAASPGDADGNTSDDWEPLPNSANGEGAAPSKSAAAPQVAAPKVQVVKSSG